MEDDDKTRKLQEWQAWTTNHIFELNLKSGKTENLKKYLLDNMIGSYTVGNERTVSIFGYDQKTIVTIDPWCGDIGVHVKYYPTLVWYISPEICHFLKKVFAEIDWTKDHGITL